MFAPRPTKNGVVTPCKNLSEAELATLEDETMTREQRASAAIQDNAPAAYSIYMFDPAKQQWLNIAAPPAGFMFTDPVAIEPRAVKMAPPWAEPTSAIVGAVLVPLLPPTA